jgi:hypothetical protein
VFLRCLSAMMFTLKVSFPFGVEAKISD